MTYSIFDNGNLVVSYDRARDAYEAFERILAANPDGDGGLLLVAFDEHGRIVDDCAPGARLAHAV